MQLKKVRLINVCQHRKLEVEFGSGMNAILGANGTGKSNLVNSIYAAITNDFSRFTGNKLHQISQFATDKEKSSIELDFEHRGNNIHIFRGLRPNRKYITVNSDEKITNEKKLASTLSSLVGVPAKLLADYVFVDQWQLFAFLLQTQGERAKAIERLFGLDKAEVCWKVIGEHIAKLSSAVIIGDEDAARQRLTADVKNLKEQQRVVRRLQLVLNNVDIANVRNNTDELAAVVKQYSKKQQLEEKLARLKPQLEMLAANLQQEAEGVADAKAVWADVSRQIQRLEPQALAAIEALKNIDRYNSFCARRAKVTKSIVHAEQVIAELASPVDVMPAGYIAPADIDDSTKLLAELESDLAACMRFLKAVDNDAVLQCPTCGTSTLLLSQKREEYREKRKRLAEQADSLRRALTLSDEYDYLENDRLKSLADWQDRLKFLNERLSEEPPEIHDNANETELRKTANIYTSRVDVRDKQKTRYLDLKTELAHTTGQHRQLTVEYETTVCETANLSVTEEEAAAADNKRRGLLKTIEELAAATAVVAALVQVVADDREDLADIVEQKKKNAKRQQLLDMLDEMRAILHREALPKAAAKLYLNDLTDDINEVLELLDSPFRVEPTDELGFRALFHDNRDVPAEALSGGEKAVFAIAFRIVVNSTFASEVGLLCLDEPTAGLDDKNIGCLTIALDKLKQLSKATGLQCVMITHERSLMPHFDKVIEL